MTPLEGYADLADLPEDERIDIIGRMASHGKVVGVFVDDDVKADRYIDKLVTRYPVRIVDRGPGITAGTVMFRVGPKES